MYPNANTVHSLAPYVTLEDGALTRDQFLQVVADRINDDLAGRQVDPYLPARERIEKYLDLAKKTNKAYRSTTQVANACYLTTSVTRRLLHEKEAMRLVKSMEGSKDHGLAGNPTMWRAI